MLIAEKLTYELHALMIAYCRKRLKELPEVEIRTWRYRGKDAEFCITDGHAYVSTGVRGKKLLPDARLRAEYEASLDLLLASWKKKFGNARIPIYKPRIVTRVINDRMTMDRRYFNGLMAGMNDYLGNAELVYKGVIYKSKSEREIARVYDELGFEIKYETPVYMNGVKYTPDFVAYSRLTGRCFYHEHQGRMGDAQYRNDKARTHHMYSSLGLIEGLDIIYTYEGGGIVFDPENLKYEITALILRNLDCA